MLAGWTATLNSKPSVSTRTSRLGAAHRSTYGLVRSLSIWRRENFWNTGKIAKRTSVEAPPLRGLLHFPDGPLSMPDWEKVLDTPWFAFDHMAIFSDLREFLEFAESNIAPQKAAAIQCIKDTEVEFEHDMDEQSYRQYQLQTLDFRFDVALPMRIRYAALMSFIGTVEWSMKVMKPTFPVPKTPAGSSETVHLIREFAARCGLPRRYDHRRQAQAACPAHRQG